MTSLAIYNEFGKIIGVSQTIRDITIQQHAEKQILSINASLERKVTERTHALQQALSENKTLLDNINQQLLYSETDKNGTILAVNDYFCSISGLTREQMIGGKPFMQVRLGMMKFVIMIAKVMPNGLILLLRQ